MKYYQQRATIVATALTGIERPDREWFDHASNEMRKALEVAGYTVESVEWEHAPPSEEDIGALLNGRITERQQSILRGVQARLRREPLWMPADGDMVYDLQTNRQYSFEAAYEAWKEDL